jgi:transposase
MAHSDEIRKLAIEKHKSGVKLKVIFEHLQVPYSTLKVWIKEYKETKKIEPGKPGPRGPSKIDREALEKYMETHENETIEKIAAHFCVSKSGINSALKMIKCTYKKNS